MLPELTALQKKHKEWLRDTPAGKRAAAQALAAYVDKSVPNLSSIVVLAEVGGKTILFTSTARSDDEYQIHLTYPIDEIDVLRKKDWETERGKEIKRHAKNQAVKVRAEWSDATNSLAAFLDDNPDVNDRIVIVEDGVPHTIDLLG